MQEKFNCFECSVLGIDPHQVYVGRKLWVDRLKDYWCYEVNDIYQVARDQVQTAETCCAEENEIIYQIDYFGGFV